MKKKIVRFVHWLKSESPTIVRSAIMYVVPLLIKLGLKSLKDI